MESFLVQYEEALSSVNEQVLSFEPSESGFIRQEFLEGELTSKMQKAQDSLSATTDMINQQLNSVSDLASVSHVQDSGFLESIADVKKKISKTVDGMYEMDSNATSKLNKSEDDIQQMKTYVSKLRDAIDKNNITVDKFNIIQFNSAFFSYHNEFKLMAKGRNALVTGEKAEITAEEFNQLYPYIKNEENIIDEYYEWNGTYHTLKDGRIIREYMYDTGVSYEFVDKIPEPRSKPLSDTEEFVYGAVGEVWDFFTEDLATVLDPDATKGEKAFALAMFLPIGKPVKIVDKGSGFVSDGIKNLDKLIKDHKSIKTGPKKTGRFGEDLNKLGTGKVGDFTNLKDSTIDDVLTRIPKDAKRRELTPVEGKVTEGFEYKWTEDGKTMRIRLHGPDASAPDGSNAKKDWIVRVQQGKKYLDPVTGEYQPPGITNINSPNFNEELANRTHIPVKSPH